MVRAIMIHPDDFVIITPRTITTAPLVDLDIDAPRTMDVFNRLQKAQIIGRGKPELLVIRGPEVPDQTYLPIKAPGTLVFVPDWFEDCGMAQLVASHRFATSQHADAEMWSLLYEHRRVWAGQPARYAPLGPHIDDRMSSFLQESAPSRLSTLYAACSSVPTIYYDGLGKFNLQAYRATAEASDFYYLDRRGIGEEEDARRDFFKGLLRPEAGRTYEPGTVVIANGATPQEVAIAPAGKGYVMRGFAQIRMAKTIFPDQEIEKLNPPLWKAMQLTGSPRP
jgi:hypothetical protein